MILLLDNYDSFVHNLRRYLRELGETVEVRRNDRVPEKAPGDRRPTHLVISPGPCGPEEAGVSNELIRELAGPVPLLGVCLGHQCIGAVFGGRIVRAREPMHGKVSRIRHGGAPLFAGLPDPFRATRYHSLVIEERSLPGDLEVTAWTNAGEIMAVRHRSLPVWGVQFHPEALLTDRGHAILANFLALGRGQPPPGRVPDGAPAELAAGAEAEPDAHRRVLPASEVRVR